MKLPLVPSHDKEYEVNEYPSNKQVLDLIRVQLRNETVSDDAKERLQEEYGLKDATVSEELGQYEAEHEVAQIVFSDFDGSEAGPMEISPNAVGEATDVFMHGGRGTSGELESTLSGLLSALSAQRETT